MAFVGTVAGVSAADDDFRVGTIRSTMKTNPLLTKAELGKVKKTTFPRNDPEHVFGYMPPKDPEGAREVTGIWKEHNPSPGNEAGHDGKPRADFKEMNKLATINGLTTAKESATFRQEHYVAMKPRDQTAKAAPSLPSDKEPKHTYGQASAFRSAQTIRNMGPEEPPVKHLVQGAYQTEWVEANAHKVASSSQQQYIPPVPTRAAVGHAIGAQKYLQKGDQGEEWKMSKFKAVPSKVTAYFGSSGKPSGNSAQREERVDYDEGTDGIVR